MADRVVQISDGCIASVVHNPERLSPRELSW
jgi:hypothetical protein